MLYFQLLMDSFEMPSTRLTTARPNFEEQVAHYQRRSPKYSGDDSDARLEEVMKAYASNMLSGAKEPSPEFQAIAQLWAEGKISNSEYLELCDISAIKQENTAASPKFLTPHPKG